MAATINIQPTIAVSDGCSASFASYHTGQGYIGYGPSDSQYAYTNYQLIATAATGWAIDKIVYHYSWTASDGTSGTSASTTRRIEVNPFYQPATQNFTTYEFPGDFQKISGGDFPVHTTSQEITSIDIYFKTGPTPPPSVKVVTATASPSDGGTVQVGTAESGTTSSQAVQTGGSINIVATPASGYAFKGWYQNGAQISASATYTVSNVTADQSFEARFVQVFHVQVVAFKSGAYVSLNGSPGDDIQSAWTVAEGDFEYGASITIAATSKDATMSPFKAWYRDPDAWGNPEYTGTLVPGAGATYTTTVTANVVYFATFDYLGTTVEVKTYSDLGPGRSAPDAVLTINGQGDGDNDFTLAVLKGSSAVLGASAYGGLEAQDWPYPMYFVGWLKYPDYDTIVSENLEYTFQTSQSSYWDTFYAKYATHYELKTDILPSASSGRVALSPASRYGNNLYADGANVTLTATPSAGWRFKHWIFRDRWGDEVVSTNSTYVVGVDYRLIYDTVYIAVFEWDGTDLLVNSSDLGSPVQLVYDPNTNLLVADC